MLLITPLLEPSGSVIFDNDGYVSLTEHSKQINTLQNPVSRAVYDSGDYMCHQKNSRSFIINNNQMSYCVRCFGIFLGMAIGAGIATFVWIEPKWWLIIGGMVPLGLDGGLQLITSYESNNLFRILTGSLVGIVTMIVIGLVVIELGESLKLWMSYQKQKRIKSTSNNRS